MKRIFFLSNGNGNSKFWSIEVQEKTLTTTYGKTYGIPKNSSKDFPSDEKCLKEAEKLISKKLKEDYEEVMLNIPGVAVNVLKRVEDAKKNDGEKLYVDMHKSEELVREVFSITSLKELQITNLTTLPPAIGELKKLEVLEIESCCQLETIPAEIGCLTSLRKLMIRDTAISNLPASIGQLNQLQTLYIWGNRNLQNIPVDFNQLKKLKRLWIVYNREGYEKGESTIQLPDDLFTGLDQLEELDLSSNNLSGIPPSLATLRQLRKLKIHFNNLSAIPSPIFELENLERLDLGSSKGIQTIPADICRLQHLSDLSIDDSAITNIPAKSLQNGMIGIRKHFLGDTKKKKSTMVAAAPANRTAIIKQYKDRFDQFRRSVANSIYTKQAEKAFAGLLKYLTGESNTLPAPVTDDDEYYLRDITCLLAPYREWTFVERRTLAYMTQEAWSVKKGEDGLHSCFYEWLGKQLTDNDYPGFYKAVIHELVTFGIEEKLSLQHSLQIICRLINTRENTYLTTSFNDFVLAHAPAQLPMMIRICLEYGYARDYLTALLLRNQVKEFEQYILELVTIQEYESEDGSKHIRYETLETICAADPVKYEHYALELLQQSDCLPCKAETARVLTTLYGDKYRLTAMTICRDTLQYISHRKNKDHSYQLRWSENPGYSDGTPQFIEWIIKHLGNDLHKDIFDYVENTKVLSLDVTRIVVKHLGQQALDIAAEALDMTIESNDIAAHFRQLFTILAPLDYSKYYDKVWAIACCEYKEVRQTACLALSRQNPALVIPKVKELLLSKKAHEREAGILILGLINSPDTIFVLKPLLQTEKNDNVRDVVVDFVYKDEDNITLQEAHKRIAAAKMAGKLDKPVAKWVDEKKLAVLKWTDGTILDTAAVRFLLYRQTRQKAISPDPEAKAIYSLIDKNSSGNFAKQLLDLIMKNGGAKAQNRFALSLIGLLGDERIIQPLQDLAIKETNENACTTLGLNSSWEAARALDKIMQAFRTRYPNIKAAANEAFENIADSKGITPFELMDMMIPDFGFTNRTLAFTIGKDHYQAIINHQIKLAFVDHQQKPVKTLPKTTPEALKKTFKETSAVIRDVAKQQSINLENYLVIQRKWKVEEWNRFFQYNALAFAFAQNFVWGAYTGNKLTDCFCLYADGGMQTVQNKPFHLTEDCTIGLVHPIEMPAADLQVWKTYFDTAGITPPFAQLNRQLFTLPPADKDRKILYTYENKELDASTFKARAEKLGWRRGSVIDSGSVSTYRKNFPNEQVEVFIATENLGVTNYDYDTKMSLGELYFVKTGSIVTGSYIYDEPHNEQDHRLIKLAALPAIVYSEAIADIEKIIRSKEEEKEA